MTINVKKTLLKAKNLAKKGDVAKAEQLYRQVLAEFPANREAVKGLSKAEAGGGTGIEITSGPFQQKVENLVALFNRGHLQQVAQQARALVSQFPGEALVYNLLGAAESGLGNYDQAVEALTEAIRLFPGYAEAYNNLGATYNKLGRSSDAVACYRKVVELQPGFAEAYSNMANALKVLGELDAAIANYLKAIELQPGFADAHYNLGSLLGHVHRFEEGIAHCSRALEINPSMTEARSARLFQLAKVCDWHGIEKDSGFLSDLGITEGSVPPFTLLSFEDSPENELRRAERFAHKHYPVSDLPSFNSPSSKSERIRVGYFSADFHNHATMYLMAGLFDHHDRNGFEIHVFSYGKVQGDEMGQRLASAVDAFHDVRYLSDRDVALLAREQGIDIAVDLKGYTQEARLGIFAYRAAPIQVSYLGYPGTSGAPFMDYMIADHVVIPDKKRQFYSEKIIYLPNSYQVNDENRAIGEQVILRSDAGLPEDAFVYCCFNNSYKIGPEEYDIWMRLLAQKEHSVLWLLDSNSAAVHALKAEARARGISSDRLVFAPQLPYADHLARIGLADLFLDTFNYNAHTSASDALWAGVPVVTLLGESFSARVAASLLRSVGLSELVSHSPAEYEQFALELASDSQRLSSIKAFLIDEGRRGPLFDTRLFATHLEEAFSQVYKRYLGEAGAIDITVSA